MTSPAFVALDAMRKALFAFLLLAATLFSGGAPAWAQSSAQAKPVDLVLFYGRGCPYCAAMRDYLADAELQHPQMRVDEREIYFDADNVALFEKLAAAYGTKIQGVPTLFIGIGDRRLRRGDEAGHRAEDHRVHRERLPLPARPPVRPERCHRAHLTLTAVVTAAAVDAINPCAFAVLIILITAVLGAGSRHRALYAGLAFSLPIFISYYLMGLGVYSAVEAAGATQALYVVVGVLAILIGLFNLKDYLWYGRWFVMEVPLPGGRR